MPTTSMSTVGFFCFSFLPILPFVFVAYPVWWVQEYTEEFREISHGSDDHGIFDCTTWEAIAAGYTVDGEYLYVLEVLDAATEADRAIVHTRETDLRDAAEYDYTYTLVPNVDGVWVIDSIVETEN